MAHLVSIDVFKVHSASARIVVFSYAFMVLIITSTYALAPPLVIGRATRVFSCYWICQGPSGYGRDFNVYVHTKTGRALLIVMACGRIQKCN